MDRSLLWMILVMLGASVLSGCGDDDAEGGEPAPMDSGTLDGGGAGGTGGTSGTGGAGGTGGAPATSVECGTTTCESPAAAMGFISACCVDEAASTCGTSLMGGPCAETPEGDPRCESLDIMGFLMIPSCCTDDGQCGIDASGLGMPGCIDLATAAEQSAMMGMGAGIELPQPRACDDGDAGTEDGGT